MTATIYQPVQVPSKESQLIKESQYKKTQRIGLFITLIIVFVVEIINGKLLDFKKNGDCKLIEMERRRLSPERLERLKLYLQSQITSNYYWWSDSR